MKTVTKKKYLLIGALLTSLSVLSTGCATAVCSEANCPVQDDPCSDANIAQGGPPAGCDPQTDVGSDFGSMVVNGEAFDDNFGNNEFEKGGIEHDPKALAKQTSLAATAKQDPRLGGRNPASGANVGGAAGGAGQGEKGFVVTTSGGTPAAGAGFGLPSKSLQQSGDALAEAEADPNKNSGGAFGSSEGGSAKPAAGAGGDVFSSLIGKGAAGEDAGVAGAPGISFGMGEGTKDPFNLESYLSKNGGRSLFDVVNEAYGRKSPDILKHR